MARGDEAGNGAADATGAAAGKSAAGIVLFLLLAVLAAAAVGYVYRDLLRGTRIGTLLGLQPAATARVIYYCPMHPDYRSDKPGTCPICNMTLEKLEPGPQGAPAPAGTGSAGGEAAAPTETAASGPAAPPGTVQISPAKQQLIGIRTEAVEERALVQTIRTVGRLAYAETSIARINPKISGWIEQVHVDFTGKPVKPGQPLVSVYSPELVTAQQELLIAKKARNALGGGRFQDAAQGSQALYQSARQKLLLWDIGDEQIRRIEAAGVPSRTLTLYAPIGGFVVSRNAYPGQRIGPETELYTIADYSTIWVLADIYEYEIPLLRPGQTGTIILPYFPGKTYSGRVTFIYPELDPATRTLKVRLELPNPDLELKPDMYANVEFVIDHGRQLAVSQDAVLDSGAEQRVFVVREGGVFEARQVTLGRRVGDQVTVLAGLEAGERVVNAATFLIDSESQLKSALSGMSGAAAGPHAGHGGQDGHEAEADHGSSGSPEAR